VRRELHERASWGNEAHVGGLSTSKQAASAGGYFVGDYRFPVDMVPIGIGPAPLWSAGPGIERYWSK
jgi:hypothetical protein